MSIRSTAWVRMKPSTHTIVGTESSSARRKATMWRSAASWFDSAKSWIQPDSRKAMASEWSFQIIDRRADRPVSQRHDDRQAEAGCVVDGLRHEQEALARRRSIGSRAGEAPMATE